MVSVLGSLNNTYCPCEYADFEAPQSLILHATYNLPLTTTRYKADLLWLITPNCSPVVGRPFYSRSWLAPAAAQWTPHLPVVHPRPAPRQAVLHLAAQVQAPVARAVHRQAPAHRAALLPVAPAHLAHPAPAAEQLTCLWWLPLTQAPAMPPILKA